MDMTEWSNFFIASGGAAAALTGLIFVAVSINLSKILSIPHLPARALESLVILMNILFVSLFCLVPGQTLRQLGMEIAGLGVLFWGVTLWIDVGILLQKMREYLFHHVRNLVFSQLSMVPYIVSGLLVFNGHAGGLYWLIPGIFFSFLKALTDAWVMLVEINR
jgi:hypothetical protein